MPGRQSCQGGEVTGPDGGSVQGGRGGGGGGGDRSYRGGCGHNGASRGNDDGGGRYGGGGCGYGGGYGGGGGGGRYKSGNGGLFLPTRGIISISYARLLVYYSSLQDTISKCAWEHKRNKSRYSGVLAEVCL